VGGETIVFGEIRKNVLVRFDGFHLHTRTHTHTQKDVFVNSDSVYLLEIDTEKSQCPSIYSIQSNCIYRTLENTYTEREKRERERETLSQRMGVPELLDTVRSNML